MSHQQVLSTVNPSAIPAGWHIARLIRFIDIGTIAINDYYSDVKKVQHQVILTWEFPEQKRLFSPHGQPTPKVVSRQIAYTLYGKAHLGRFIYNWFGESILQDMNDRENGVDPHLLIGKPCEALISVSRNNNTGKWFEKVEDIRYVNPVLCEPQHNPSVVFEYGHPDFDQYKLITPFIRKKMKESDEYIKFEKQFPQVKELDASL